MAVIRVIQTRGKIAKNGERPIYVTFYLHQEKIQIPCKVSTSEKNFDGESGKITIGDKRHKDKNLIIDNIRARVNNVMVKYRLKDKQLTKDIFIREYNRPDDFQTFYEYFSYYVKRHPNEIEASTLDVHIDVINKLKVYRPTLYFDEITEDFIHEYKGYLKKKLDNKDSTINKNLAVLKKYVRAAIREGYISDNPFENIRISRKTNGIPEYLTEEELTRMAELYQSNRLTPGMKSSLEVFLFMCFTSLHIGDARSIHIEQIGSKNITYYRIKLRNSKPAPIQVPLSIPAKAIIKRIRKNRNHGPLFINLVPDQKINFYLRRLADMADINKKISCKSGRHTFATIFLDKTKDFSTLKEILGHSDLRETFIYAHILDQSKQDGIKVFNSFKL